jgi:hypothetical protein
MRQIYKTVKKKENSDYQTFFPVCSAGAFEYAGHSFLLQELITNTVMKETRSKTANFFIPDTII